METNKLRKTQQNAAFCGPARQMGAGAGDMGAFAMRMGRVAIPIVRKYILPVAKQVGKNLLEAAIPEFGQILADRKRPSGRRPKHVAETTAEKSPDVCDAADRRAGGDSRLPGGARYGVRG